MPKKKEELVPVSIIALLEEPTSHSPVVILHDPALNRVLPIWIGEPEARAIAIAFQSVQMPRPLTHTLLNNIIVGMGGRLERVVIEKIESGTYFARIDIDTGEEFVSIDARPSDSIALALEAGAPLFVAKSVLDVGGQDNPFPSAKEGSKPAKQSFSKQELTDLKKLLDKAREREQGSED